MDSQPLDLVHRNLPLLFLQARESVFARFRPILNTVGLTEQQWRVVRALLDHGPLEPRQIGDICRLSSPSLAGILARMDDLGLVLRERLENDQRRVRVSVTPKGKALAASLAPTIEATYRELENQLGVEFIAHLYATLDEVIAKLGTAPDSGDGS
ncbi:MULTISPECIES: homoprotocatechuate degradation operon regulator HpaR [unclassified Acidovorax]|uniref:homoprotocatechuate degradation operon regulator HpaR n=1 Tax=unclassified Acidovorax TaxID=2684926 RepID=UPI001C481EDF|nr:MULTISPECIES: homoprotocatechuate degradation operon regulator HpaR [unclassified Acidovorax]MBV7428376.1 homoprotocatechuate degradation operon regulator HpaR [Acidovorax sp. sif0732]MBV7449632.1 homoprotocatechuate degradation operon regulator HpaR [Acidovorax sp. sif0715]